MSIRGAVKLSNKVDVRYGNYAPESGLVRLGNSSPKMAEVYVMAMAMALAVVASAAAPSRSILLGGGSRLSVLTPRVVRLEMETSEDEPSEPPTPTQLEFVFLQLYSVPYDE